jgi:hypothetical protein
MDARLRSQDFLAGLLFVAAGLFFFWMSQDYAMGTTRRMGPGYFPAVLSVLLVLIGIGVLLAALRVAEPVRGFAMRGFLAVILGTVAFGVLVRDAGIVVAVMALVLISAAGNPRTRWLPMLALAAGMALFCWLVFVKALGLPIPVLGAWFS